MAKKSRYFIVCSFLLLFISILPASYGALYDSEWTDTPPTIDGVKGEVEWGSANGRSIQIWSYDYATYFNVFVSTFNDANNLYVLLEWNDGTPNGGDRVELLFDEGNDGNWSTPGIENGIAVQLNATHYNWTDGYCALGSTHVLPDIISQDGQTAATWSGYYRVEFSIPLGSTSQDDLQPTAGALIGMVVMIGNDSTLHTRTNPEFNGTCSATIQLASAPIGTPIVLILLVGTLLLIALVRHHKKSSIPSFFRNSQ